MFQKLEGELRDRGEGVAADAVSFLLRLRGKDIPLCESAAFTPEQGNALERKGGVIYELSGQSIATLRAAGHPFWSTWHKGGMFETIVSLRTEVAIFPNSFFLPNSNFKTLDQQLAMVADFGKEIGREVPGTTAILGSVSDYAEVAFAHAQTGQRLFGEDFNYDFTRTTTPTGGSDVAIIGAYFDHGLYIRYWPRGDGYGGVWAAPLVVPVSAVGR